jgi:hypothetical protein
MQEEKYFKEIEILEAVKIDNEIYVKDFSKYFDVKIKAN